MDVSVHTSRAQAPGESLGKRFREPAVVVWHELECGRYTADMELWRDLAAQARTVNVPDAADITRAANVAGASGAATILDVGAGSGRVSLALAHEGHAVIALDREQALLDALTRRAQADSLAVSTLCADARDFTLSRRDFALCLIPMQTIQLLGDADGRLAFLCRARAHLRPGGLLACAIVTELDSFHCDDGDAGPSPDVTWVGDKEYSSRATSVQADGRRIRIERVRTITRSDGAEVSAERNVIQLDRVGAVELQRECRRAGFQAHGLRTIGETTEHVGSEVVVLRA